MVDALEERTVDCPCCGARFTALIDPSEGDAEYIQDCTVCCNPLRFTLATDPADGGIALTLSREDET